MEEDKFAMIVSADGAQLMQVNSVGVKDDLLCVNGSLMGAWPTDMFLDAEGVKNVMRVCDIPAIVQWAVVNVMGGSVRKL